MRRFDGNSILIITSARAYGAEVVTRLTSLGAQGHLVSHMEEAIKLLQQQDFDIVLSDYYLPDGLFFQLIDWCKTNLDALPIFAALGSGFPMDEELMQRHFLSGIFMKSNVEKLLKNLHTLLFDFNSFYESLLEMVDERGITLELLIGKEKILVKPIEITGKGIFITTDKQFNPGTLGLLRVSLFERQSVESFVIIGSFGNEKFEGHNFLVNHGYEKTWDKLLSKIAQKQISITNFIEKATGT